MLLDCLKQTTKTDHPSASRLANDLCLVTSARLYAVKSTEWVEREENRPGTCTVDLEPDQIWPDSKICEHWHFQCLKVLRAAKDWLKMLVFWKNIMGVSPIPFIFAQLWFLCAAVRPSIDEEARAAIESGKMRGKVQSCHKTMNTVEKDETHLQILSPENLFCSATKGILCSSRLPILTHARMVDQPSTRAWARTWGIELRFYWRATRRGCQSVFQIAWKVDGFWSSKSW